MALDNYGCGRWGEADTEKGPVDLFLAEPTDEQPAARRPWTWVQGLLGTKKPRSFDLGFFRAEDGTLS